MPAFWDAGLTYLAPDGRLQVRDWRNASWLWRLQKHPSVQEITNLIWSYINLMLIGEKEILEALTEADAELSTVLSRE